MAAVLAAAAAILPLTEGAQYWKGTTSLYNSMLALAFEQQTSKSNEIVFSSNRILINGDISYITAECMYADWLLWSVAAIALLCRSHRALLFAIAFVVVIVVAVNPFRIWLSILGSHAGLSWFMAHDLVDTMICYPSLLLLVILCMKDSRRSTQGELI